jgi:hypothetical protein
MLMEDENSRTLNRYTRGLGSGKRHMGNEAIRNFK